METLTRRQLRNRQRARVHTCKRKRRYAQKKEARAALLQCWRKHRQERSFYPCEVCGGFHITKQPPGDGREV